MQIQAKVSERILSKADRLFTNTLRQVFVELLQNARRAGATEVAVVTAQSDEGGTLISVTDNGAGIDDFQRLLDLGGSGWDSDVEEKEDPAGMGLFSLLHSGVTIASRGKQVTLTREAFLGQQAVEVKEQAVAMPEQGTELRLLRLEPENQVHAILKAVVKFGRLPVTLNGTAVERRDFLADAAEVTEYKGVRIGVFVTPYRPNAYNQEIVNFHGLVVKPPSKLLWGFDSPVLLDGQGKEQHVWAKIDVLSSTSLHLKLPDRSAIVEDVLFDDIAAEIERVMYRYIKRCDQSHIAPFRLYKRALKLGIDIGEAVPYLKGWHVPPRDRGSFRTFDEKPHPENSVRVVSDIAIVEEIDSAEHPAAFAFEYAVKDHKMPVLVSPKDEFKGYSWYGKIRVLQNFELLIDGKLVEEENIGSTIVSRIGLQFEIVDPTSSMTTKVAWDGLDIAAWTEDCTGDDYCLAISEVSEWARKSELGDLPAIVEYVGFFESDSEGADSYDTQLDDFREAAMVELLRILGGSLQVARHRVNKALDWAVRDALNNAQITEFRVYKNEEGIWVADIQLPAAA